MNDDGQADTSQIGRRAFIGMAAGAGIGAMGSATTAQLPVRVPAPCLLDAVSLSAAIHARRLSCVEVMTAYLDHIARVNPTFNAIVALQDPEALLAQAHERDAQLSQGHSLGVLHGFPHAVKDLEWVKGMRSTSGSPIFKDFVPTEDGLMVGRLRDAGAIFIGKTNAPEFGIGSSTYNPVYGITRNAYNPAVSAGGSSGGAACALALRMVPVADGSDHGGSLRNPAGWNNVYGFRTSFGCIPSSEEDAWLNPNSVLGPMARNTADLALLLSVQAGFSPRVPFSSREPASRFLHRLERDFKGTRIAWCGDFGGHAPCEPEVLDVCETALRTFEALGCVVEKATPDFSVDAIWRACLTLRAWETGGGLADLYKDPAQRALLKPEAVYEIEAALRLSALDVTAASLVRTQWSQAMHRLLRRFDYVVAPSAQLFPFAAEQHWPQSVDGRPMGSYHEWMKLVFLITMSGCPALAVPAGFNAHGLSMGLQIVAPINADMACLQLAHAYGLASGHERRLPPLLASAH